MTRPRTCAGCGARPVATNGSRYCYDCKKSPRGRATPPPCRKCGSTEDYYAGGLCRRCHRFAPPVAGSCIDCGGWGVDTRGSGLCEGCRGWRRRISRGEGSCASCGSFRHLNADGLCRLCRRQAVGARPHGQGPGVLEANRHGQQLYFIYPGATFHGFRRPRPAPAPPPFLPAVGYPVAYRQLVLFGLPRDLAAGRARGFPEPRDLGFAAVLDRAARDHAARHGWSKTRRIEACQGLRVLAGLQDTPGAPIRASDAAALQQIRIGTQPILDILTAEGLLEEDREPAITSWFARQVTGLPAPMASELWAWFGVLHRGSTRPPRRRPRSPVTIRLQVSWAMPVIRRWAAEGRQSLREITREDITAVLPPGGTPRATLGQGLRSLFTVLKARKVIFTNPMARVRTGKTEAREPLPLGQLAALRDALNAADPARAAMTALAAYYGLRNHDIRALLLTDVDGARLRIGGRAVLLADPVRRRLSAWLDHRAARWPATLNPHLFINTCTAVRATPVSHHYVLHTVGMAIEPIREDRILHEALATGGDARRLCDLFGLSIPTALRYTAVLDPPGLASETGQAPGTPGAAPR
jgi:hypothetical protein